MSPTQSRSDCSPGYPSPRYRSLVSIGLSLRRIRDYWVRTGHRERLTRELRPQIARLRGLVLDVGGGRHALHDDAWHPDARRIRLDLSPTHRPDIIADAAALPFPDGCVDAVVIVEVLEHVSNPASVLEEVQRVLRADGVVVGSVPFVFPIHGDPSDYYRYTDEGLRHLLSGFARSHVDPIGNRVSAAWIILASGSRTLRILNPLLRRLGSRPDSHCPDGYVFTGLK